MKLPRTDFQGGDDERGCIIEIQVCTKIPQGPNSKLGGWYVFIFIQCLVYGVYWGHFQGGFFCRFGF
jgi:hypothetical protein